MARPAAHNDGQTSENPPADARWETVQRVVASPLLARSPRLRAFLLYVCDRAIKNRTDETTEQCIGQAVFGREPGYQSVRDNIVRVEARHLRERLAEYFETEGAAEPLIIRIPRGSYLPVFEPRAQINPEPARAAPETQPAAGRSGANLLRIFVAATVVLAAVVVWLGWRQIAGKGQTRAHPIPPPWSAVLDSNHRTKVVLADSCLSLLDTLSKTRVSLADYAAHRYFDPALPASERAIYETLMSLQYTSLADVALVRRIAQLGTEDNEGLTLGYARNTNLQDFKSGHAILVGTSKANPWMELFEPKLNFRFEFDSQQSTFRNVQPMPGERAAYHAPLLDPTENYSVIALLPNLSQTGNVLIVEGNSMEGTQAAVEFLASPEFSAHLLPNLQARPGDPLRYFEVLIKSRQVAGGSNDSSVVAVRIR